MDTLDILQQSVDYIEQNLKTDISAEELSQMAGFSLFHYCRLFRAATGRSVMQYILRRRLLNGIYEIAQGAKIIDVALCYGYQTHAGFFKAFRREYGCSPSVYLKRHIALKPYKISLRQEDYLMLTHDKAAQILRYWGLEGVAISDMDYGDAANQPDNTFYIGEAYVLKASTDPTPLTTHSKLSKALESLGLAAASPIATLDGREMVVEDTLYYMVTRRLNGKPMVSGELYHGDHATKARYLGEIIGRLHTVLADCDELTAASDLYKTVCNWALPKVSQGMELPVDFVEDYRRTFGALYDSLPKQIIHRDLHPGNILMSDEGLTGFVDFDLSEVNVRIFDPCYAATAILSESFGEKEPKNPPLWIELYKNILKGYDSVVHLSDAEKQGLPYIVFSIQMICVAYFSGIDKYAELAGINQEMLHWLIKHKNDLSI